MEQDGPTITLEMEKDYRFRVDFDELGLESLRVDEMPPLGEGHGPNPVRLLAAAVGHCLSASALFCLKKARIDVRGMRTTVHVGVTRNERGRLRVGGIQVALEPHVAAADRDRMGRCLEVFEDFCVVTQSVRKGVEVKVAVTPAAAAMETP